MSLHLLLLSSDEKTVRVLRRVLSDLEIEVENCSNPETAIRKLTRQRFEAIIVDCVIPGLAETVLKSAKASPANSRAVAIVLVDSAVGLHGGFNMGGHFVLHKPLSAERARSSFRAVRALMNQERRRQTRVAVQIPVECVGARSLRKFNAQTVDLCEGGMAIKFAGHVINETPLRFKLVLPGTNQQIEMDGELAWEGDREHAGVRFTAISDDHRFMLREWIQSQLPDAQQDDPPVTCRLANLTLGACYLRTESPFPVGTGVTLSMSVAALEMRATGIVRVMHPEFGMGVEFNQTTEEQCDVVHNLIDALRESGEESPELQVSPEILDAEGQQPRQTVAATADLAGDSLVELFRQKSDLPVEAFLKEMGQHSHAASAS